MRQELASYEIEVGSLDRVNLGNGVQLKLLGFKFGQLRIGVIAPRRMTILRGEVQNDPRKERKKKCPLFRLGKRRKARKDLTGGADQGRKSAKTLTCEGSSSFTPTASDR